MAGRYDVIAKSGDLKLALVSKVVETKYILFCFFILFTEPVSCQRDPRFNGEDPQAGEDANPGGGGGGLLNPFTNADAVDRYPAWKQTYLVKYNTSTASVTNLCGTHYAEEFLKNFFKVTQESFTFKN